MPLLGAVQTTGFTSGFDFPFSGCFSEFNEKITDFVGCFMVILHISVVRIIFFCYNSIE